MVRIKGGDWLMLLGTHTPKLDDKGRVILPAKFRDDLGPGVVVTRGQERCLYVFSSAEFDAQQSAGMTSFQSRRYASLAVKRTQMLPAKPTMRSVRASR